MKILHIITGLGDGGAENTLFKICKYDKENKHIVISLKAAAKYYWLLKKLGIEVYCLKIDNFFATFNIFYLVKLLRLIKPDLVQTWLVHGDFIGGIAARLAGIKNVVWNIRYSDIKLGSSKISTFLIAMILVKLSNFVPKSIVVVSKKAKKNCENLGYNKQKLKLIFNGYDLSILKPKKNKKQLLRKKLKIDKNLPLIGKIARYDPRKDHSNLLQALALVKNKNYKFLCILVGTGIRKNKKLLNEISVLKLQNYVKLLGPKKDISLVMNDLDINIQSSTTEGFPNVVAEAMSVGIPCVATDVGDTADIIGKTGWLVPRNNSIKLAESIIKALNQIGKKNWLLKCKKARQRIKKNYSIFKMLKKYNYHWKVVCKSI